MWGRLKRLIIKMSYDNIMKTKRTKCRLYLSHVPFLRISVKGSHNINIPSDVKRITQSGNVTAQRLPVHVSSCNVIHSDLWQSNNLGLLLFTIIKLACFQVSRSF